MKKVQSCHNHPGFMNSGIRGINGTFQDLGLKDLTVSDAESAPLESPTP